MNTTAYGYDSLQANEVRLVKLLPGRWVDPIHCELQRASLDDHCEYYTLSYVWGSSRGAKRQIYLCREPFAVTINLESALRHLRLAHEDGLLIWIDALSINQADLQERTHQVELMGKIYKSSKAVFVYLGEGEGDVMCSDAPEVMRFHGDHRDSVHIDQHLDQEALEKKHQYTSRQPSFTTGEVFSFIRALGSDSHLDKLGYFARAGSPGYTEAQIAIFEALRRMMNPPYTPWWNRIWTVQEITLPPDVMMICGPVIAPWSMFGEAASAFNHHSSTCCSPVAAWFQRDLWRVLVDFSDKIRDIKNLRAAHSRQQAWSASDTYGNVQLHDLTLLRLLQRFRNRQASDQRDKVYALLSLAKANAREPEIVPDYTLSEREVYTRTTFTIMQESESLALLSTDTGRKFRNDLPSWVPDWSAPGAQSTDVRADAIRLYTVKGLKYFPDLYSIEMVTDSILQVSGKSLDIIKSVGDVMWGDSADVSRTTIKRWWDALKDASREQCLRFWELLCAGIFCEKTPHSSGTRLRRINSKDEITFVSWAVESPRSPFCVQLGYNAWSTTGYRRERPWDIATSHAAGLWRKLLHLGMSPPDAGLSVENLLGRSTPDDMSIWESKAPEPIDQILARSRSGELRNTILTAMAEEHGLFWGEKVIADGSVREDAPWTDFFREVEEKLKAMFGEELDLNVDTETRRERVAAMDASIMAATLSRRLFVLQNGDIGLAPADTRRGDQVYYVAGAATPLVLRPYTEGGRIGHFEVVGDCYLLGMNEKEPPRRLNFDSIYLV